MRYKSFDIETYIAAKSIKEIVNRLGKAHLTPTSHNYKDYGDIEIIDAAKKSFEKYHEQAKNIPAVALLEVVLAANRNYNLHVLPNIIRLKKEYPTLITFDDLNNLIDTKSEQEFYKIWGPRDEKKFSTLKNILKSIKQRKLLNPQLSDYEIMRNWANGVDLEKYTKDDIGRHPNIAIATIQHLRMTFGANTVKPDLRVMEVLEYEFGLERD